MGAGLGTGNLKLCSPAGYQGHLVCLCDLQTPASSSFYRSFLGTCGRVGAHPLFGGALAPAPACKMLGGKVFTVSSRGNLSQSFSFLPLRHLPLCGFSGHQEWGRCGQSQPSQKEAGPTAYPVGVCACSLGDHVSNPKKEDVSQQTHQLGGS